MAGENKKITKENKQFVIRIVENDYLLNDDDIISTNLIFSSDWVNPRLAITDNYFFKINYLCNILANEIVKRDFQITRTEIKDRLLKKNVVVYHSNFIDRETNRKADHFFIIDASRFKAFVFKRFSDDLGVGGTSFDRLSKVFHLEEIALDDYFSKAADFINNSDEYLSVETENRILKELAKEKAKLSAYINKNEKLSFELEKTQIDIPIKKLNKLEIRLISKEKPIIDTIVKFALENEHEELFSISGKIIRERTVSFKEFYQLDVLINFNNISEIRNTKYILTFIKSIKKKIAAKTN